MKKKEAAGQFENDALGRLSRRRLVVCTYSDGTPGEKCVGLDACVGIDASKVGCGSCIGGLFVSYICSIACMPTYHGLTSYNVRRLFYSTVKVILLAMVNLVPVSYSLMECIVPTQNKANSYVVCLASFSVNRWGSNQDTRDRGEQLQWLHCVSGPL